MSTWGGGRKRDAAWGKGREERSACSRRGGTDVRGSIASSHNQI